MGKKKREPEGVVVWKSKEKILRKQICQQCYTVMKDKAKIKTLDMVI